MFAKSGSMIPLALQPGVPLDGFDPALAQPAIGSAAREPDLLSWEVWMGSSLTGRGTVWEESRGASNVSYALTDQGKTLTLRVSQPEATDMAGRTHRFELQNVPLAKDVAKCGSSMPMPPDYNDASYDPRALALNVHVDAHYNSHTDERGGCLVIHFHGSITADGGEASSPGGGSLRGIPYKTLRQRLHVIKQRFDDLVTRPGLYLMPIVEATNTADRIGRRAAGAAAGVQWAAELAAFGGRVNAALRAIEQWAASAKGNQKTGPAAQGLLAVSKAWICDGAAAAQLELEACH